MADRVWISWNEQRRNIGLAAAVRADLFMSDHNCPGWLRLIKEFLESWRIIKRERPSICFVMNPSIFSSWWLSFIAKIYRFSLVTDLHTPNVSPRGIKKFFFNHFFRSGIRRSDLVIVTNNIYRQEVLKLNSSVAVVPDPLPDFDDTLRKNIKKYSDEDKPKIELLFVCSFDPDEPVEKILSLDSEIDDVEIKVTGDWQKKYRKLPDTKNIKFLGFISKEEYDRRLLSADAIIVLTELEGCLCCGAYEAFAAGKPLILSKTAALMEYFGDAPIYVDNSSESILSAIRQIKDEMNRRERMIVEGRQILINKFDNSIDELERMLAGLKA